MVGRWSLRAPSGLYSLSEAYFRGKSEKIVPGKIRGVVPGAGWLRGNVNIDKSQCSPPEVNLNFRRVVVREYVTIRHPVGDWLVGKSDKFTIASGRAIVPDGGTECELFEGRVFNTGDQHLVTVKEVLQFSIKVLDAVAKSCLPQRQVLERLCSSGQGTEVWWIPRMRVERVLPKSEDSGGPGSSLGPEADNPLWNEFRCNGGGIVGQTEEQPSRHALGCCRQRKGLGRGLGAAQSPPPQPEV